MRQHTDVSSDPSSDLSSRQRGASRIVVLEDAVANRIAAGEVIERPASVVKELVENAIDARATRLDIEIERGGKALVRITDNGIGMSYDDVLLSLERHATSKVRRAEDLLRIDSFGFRGEALPSIASVSRFRLLSRETEAISGTEVKVDGGKLLSVHEAGAAPGTCVEVRSLFFHLPARRKFLRADATEWAHIEQYLRLVALAKPDISFTITHNQNRVAHFPGVPKLRDRIGQIFGREWLSSVIPLDTSQGAFRLCGVIGKPGTFRNNRNEHLFFVNGRPVQNNTLNFAALEGYRNALMKGRFPVLILFFEMDPARVDINVHPAKREVRFYDDAAVRSFVAEAIAGALRSYNREPVETDLEDRQASRVLLPPEPPPSTEEAPPDMFSRAPVTPPAMVASPSPPVSEPPLSEEVSPPLASPLQRNHDLTILGTAMGHYLVAQNDSGVVLVDQRAAHERILFEQMLDRLAREEILSQKLLLPVTIELVPQDADFLNQQMDSLQKLGLGVAGLGGGTFMIDAVPPFVETQEIETFFREMLTELQEAGGQTQKNRKLSEEAVVRAVCQSSVKRRAKLNPEEVEKLLIDLHACELPYTCPKGRPTMIFISRNELEKKFGRTP